MNELLEFNRIAIAHGELWRLLTGHLVHFNASHAAWDIGATLGLVAALHCLGERIATLLRPTLVTAIAISAAVWFLCPEIERYRGLSGITCALFGLLLCRIAGRARTRGDWLLLALVAVASTAFVAKLVFELTTAVTIFTSSGDDFVPVPLSHTVGFVTGCAWGSGFRNAGRHGSDPAVADAGTR